MFVLNRGDDRANIEITILARSLKRLIAIIADRGGRSEDRYLPAMRN